jgi:hypothetical protein
MEQLIPEGVRLLAQQGTGWVLFLFVTAGGVWVLRRLLSDQQRWMLLYEGCQKASQDIQEKRLGEARETTAALNAGAAANMKLALSMDARTQSLETLATLVTQMNRDMERNREMWLGHLSGLLGDLKDIRERIERLERR